MKKGVFSTALVLGALGTFYVYTTSTSEKEANRVSTTQPSLESTSPWKQTPFLPRSYTFDLDGKKITIRKTEPYSFSYALGQTRIESRLNFSDRTGVRFITSVEVEGHVVGDRDIIEKADQLSREVYQRLPTEHNKYEEGLRQTAIKELTTRSTR